MREFLNVLYVIWGAGSIIGVIVSFLAMELLSGEKAKGVAFLAFLAALGSMSAAIAVHPG